MVEQVLNVFPDKDGDRQRHHDAGDNKDHDADVSSS